jgi:hypothetical protein
VQNVDSPYSFLRSSVTTRTQLMTDGKASVNFLQCSVSTPTAMTMRPRWERVATMGARGICSCTPCPFELLRGIHISNRNSLCTIFSDFSLSDWELIIFYQHANHRSTSTCPQARGPQAQACTPGTTENAIDKIMLYQW